MRLLPPAWMLVLSLHVLQGQAGREFELSALDRPGDPDPGSAAWQKSVAVGEVLKGFNGIGGNAGALRRAMTREDAEAFDAVMLDLMGALIALPPLGVAHSGDPARIALRKPRYDRVPQIRPELLGLERFFARLQQGSSSAADNRMFAAARRNVRRMLSALPLVLPTVSAKEPPA